MEACILIGNLLSLSLSLNLHWFAGTFPKESIHLVKEHAEICTSSVVSKVANIGWNRFQQHKNLKISWDRIHARISFPLDVAVNHFCCILFKLSLDCTLVKIYNSHLIVLSIFLHYGDIQFRHFYVISVYFPIFGRHWFCLFDVYFQMMDCSCFVFG